MQADADEVGGAVGRRAYEQSTVGHKVVNLGGKRWTPADEHINQQESSRANQNGEATCSMASIRVMVLPVPGGPKST